jgi:CshA-type fibril repeat protein
MKLFNRLLHSIFLLIIGANIFLYATGTERQIITDDKTSPSIENRLGVTAVIELSAHFNNSTVAVSNYIIKSLPDAKLGILYMSDGKTPIFVGQHLIQSEADCLHFDPIESDTSATAKFTYVGVDSKGIEGSVATVTIPLIVGGCTIVKECISVVSDDKRNIEMLNTLGPTDIIDLSGRNSAEDTIESFIITSIPDKTHGGILYFGDGTTPIEVGQLLTFREAGGLRFDPADDFVGDVVFNYIAVDNNGIRGNSATVTIPIIATTEIEQPIADDKKNPEMLNTLGAVNILDLSGKDAIGNDVDSYIITSLPNRNQGILYMADGTSVVKLDQILTQEEANGLKFDPNANFVGVVTFTYMVIDRNDLKSLEATVTIPLVNPTVENAPIADNKQNPEMLNTLGAVNILDLSGKDGEGNAIERFIITSLPLVNQGLLYREDGKRAVKLNETITVEEANGLKFDPSINFVGDVKFTYVAVDSNGIKSANATVTIPLISSHNTDIVANNDEGYADSDAEPITINVLANDTGTVEGATVHLIDANGNMVEELTMEEEGIWSVDDSNLVTFTPLAPFVGTPSSVSYLVQDANGAVSNSATIAISGQCVCKAYREDIPTFSRIGLLLMLLFSTILGSILNRKR